MESITRRTALALVGSGMAALIPMRGMLGSPGPLGRVAGLQFEVYKDGRGKFRWRLKSANGRVMATSGEGYESKASCRGAIAVIQRDAAAATIIELP